MLLAHWIEDGASERAADAIGRAARAVSTMYPVAKGVFALFEARLADARANLGRASSRVRR